MKADFRRSWPLNNYIMLSVSYLDLNKRHDRYNPEAGLTELAYDFVAGDNSSKALNVVM